MSPTDEMGRRPTKNCWQRIGKIRQELAKRKQKAPKEEKVIYFKIENKKSAFSF